MHYDEDELRAEIVDLISQGRMEIASSWYRCVIEDHPHVVRPSYSVEEHIQWAVEEIDEISGALEANDPSLLTYEFYHGGLVTQASAPFLSIANFIESIVDRANRIMEYIYSKCAYMPAHANKLMGFLERFLLDSIRLNLTRFADDVLTSGFFIHQLRPTSVPDCHPEESCDEQSKQESANVREDFDRVRAGDSLLTAREKDVVDLIAIGEPNKAIARRLDISLPTVKRHVSSIMSKLQLANRTEVALWAKGSGDTKDQV